MNCKHLLKLCSCILAFLILIQANIHASAHSTSQAGILAKYYIGNNNCPYKGWYIGGEDVGWGINESAHASNSTITYSFSNDPKLSSTLKSYVRSGAAKWSGTATINEKLDGTGVGSIMTFYNGESNIAALTAISAGNNGHLVWFDMSINRAKTISAVTIAHEFGHALGLTDLYEGENVNKLMYYTQASTANNPTTADKRGARVITGQHISHLWAYRYYGTLSNGKNQHVKYCTSCGGFACKSPSNSAPMVATCTYKGSSNNCTICGTPKGAAPYSVDDPALQHEFDCGDRPQDESGKEHYEEPDVLFWQCGAEELKKKLTPESDD